MLKQLTEQVRAGEPLSREQALSLYETEPSALFAAADSLRREFCGDRFDMCTIVNGKSGKCSENCRFCAQSSHYHGEAETYSLLDGETLLEQARYNEGKGVLRFAVVTSGKRLSDAEVDAVCESYRLMRGQTGIALCASHGLLSEAQLCRLKAAGVTRYHNNLESSRRYFPGSAPPTPTTKKSPPSAPRRGRGLPYAAAASSVWARLRRTEWTWPCSCVSWGSAPCRSMS